MAIAGVWRGPCSSRRMWSYVSIQRHAHWKPRRDSLSTCCAGCASGAALHGSGWAGVGGQGQRYRVRLIAGTLDAQATQRARRRQRRKAQKAGRIITAPTLAVAGWLLLLTTRTVEMWSAAEVLTLYRVRWQGELVLKKRLNMDSGELSNLPLRRVHILCPALVPSEPNGRYWRHDTYAISHRRRQMFRDRPRLALARRRLLSPLRQS